MGIIFPSLWQLLIDILVYEVKLCSHWRRWARTEGGERGEGRGGRREGGGERGEERGNQQQASSILHVYTLQSGAYEPPLYIIIAHLIGTL